MKSKRFQQAVAALVIGLTSSGLWAKDSDSEVVIEIFADNMSAENVEKNIADPIEVLMGDLEDVLLISAKYGDNEAEITVKFDPETAQRKDLVERVRQALDQMKTMPDSIISLSVTMADDIPGDADNKIRPARERSFVGGYLGNIQSSNEFIPIFTSFFQPSDRWSRLSSGQYQMSEAKSVVIGQLSACLPREDFLVHCRWKDKYGQGDVSFQFTDDYERFKASWRIDRLQGEFKWNGAKIRISNE